MDRIRRALDEVEHRRKAANLSTRAAADRAGPGFSDANWRQLVAGRVKVRGRWVQRPAKREQVLTMAAAVGALDEVAQIVGATESEVDAARHRVVIPDPAEAEIMASRHLSISEKLRLLEQLQRIRGDGRLDGA